MDYRVKKISNIFCICFLLIIFFEVNSVEMNTVVVKSINFRLERNIFTLFAMIVVLGVHNVFYSHNYSQNYSQNYSVNYLYGDKSEKKINKNESGMEGFNTFETLPDFRCRLPTKSITHNPIYEIKEKKSSFIYPKTFDRETFKIFLHTSAAFLFTNAFLIVLYKTIDEKADVKKLLHEVFFS